MPFLSRPTSTLQQASESRAVLSLDLRQLQFCDFLLGHEHQVQTAQRLAFVSTESLAEQPLRAVALGRPADTPSCRQPQTADTYPVLGRQKREESSVEPETLAEDPSEIGSAANPLCQCKAGVRQGPPLRRNPPAPLLATPLQYEPAALGPHPDQEAVCPLPLSVIWLKRPLHDSDSEGGLSAHTRLPVNG